MSTPNPERRNERARQAILTSALELCRERGFTGMTMEGIAKRAGVGKQTIYRWWPSKAAVVLEALNESVGAEADFPDTGDVVQDLRTQMTGVARLLGDERFTPYRRIIAAAQDDPEVAQALVKDMVEPRVRNCERRLEKAQRDGQIRADVDLADVVELLYAPIYYRMLMHTRPISTDQVPMILDILFAGISPQVARASG